MGIDDKISNAAEEAIGKAKESIGHVSGNKELEAEGVKEQAAARAKELGEKAHDLAEDMAADVKKSLD